MIFNALLLHHGWSIAVLLCAPEVIKKVEFNGLNLIRQKFLKAQLLFAK